ncbi:ThrRS/AlaRS common domain-containing protein [Roridomyces roridus]|uniref:ThrRS/AlaRS common domain-containing protein n=1 Tax=Roridomyces roridus TaxID=1738132 RepID=A0AAD7C495_9AGAR|nr:ThrRS/AlaRS common domain-containing protein [Roridomyces roridus]
MSVDSNYHRIISPVLREWIAPAGEKHRSTPVGLLACQRDPLLRQLDATVVSSALYTSPPPPPKGKNAKKAVIAPTISQDAVCLEVCLNDTVIFPEGGGQPTDIGVIHTLADNTRWEVLQAKRHGSLAVHYVRVPETTTGEAALVALAPGAQVRVELDQTAFDRRYDHMSLHTSQHLLSALLDKIQLPTLSWSLTSYPTPCYVELPRGMTVDEISMIQQEANQLALEGRKVHVEVEELDPEARKPVEKLESGRAVGRGLPEDYTGGVNRVVVIDGVDRNPCCGTHLPTLNNLQLFILPHTDALSRSSTTVARLYFLAGPRLINHLVSTHNNLISTAAILSCGTPQVPERVSQVIDDRKNSTRRAEDLELELAKHLASDLVRDMQGVEGTFKKHLHRTDDSGNVVSFLTAIASAFSDVAAQSGAPYLVVLRRTNTNVLFIIGSDEKNVKAIGDGLKTQLGVKGGGKGLKWSGKFVGVWKAGKVIEQVLETAV